MKPIRLIELFAGYGSQAMAFKRLGIDFEHYRVVENDKFAIRSYNAVHGTDFSPTDIRTIHACDLGIEHTEQYTYILTYSFPCTDISIAGRQAGMKAGSGTSSSLLWEVQRILLECPTLPQVLFMENVPMVHAKKNLADFQEWLDFLESAGYRNFWQDLNAKDCGVAQSRNRCYMFSFLDGSIDYHFPCPIPLEKKIVDYLEDEVPEKYYLKSARAENLLNQLIDSGEINLANKQCVDGSINRPKARTIGNAVLRHYCDQPINNYSQLGNVVVEYTKNGHNR